MRATSAYDWLAITPSPRPKPWTEMSPCHHVSTGRPRDCCTREFVANVSVGNGLNHTRPPLWSRIIGPACPGPVYGAANSYPGATAGELAVTATAGGRRSGRD